MGRLITMTTKQNYPKTMSAWVLDAPGGPEAFIRREVEVPEPTPGRVLIAVRAFGLNRSEWFTRRGDSPTVKLPQILGIALQDRRSLDELQHGKAGRKTG